MSRARRQERRQQRKAKRLVRRADRQENRSERKQARAQKIIARGGNVRRATRIQNRAVRVQGRSDNNRAEATQIMGGDASTLRLDARLLSEDEWGRFIAAVRTLKETPGYWEDLVAQHSGEATMTFAHNGTEEYRYGFLTWHRRYLLDFEADLRQIEPNIRIPYWDWRSRRRVPKHMKVEDWMNLDTGRGRSAAAAGRKIQLNKIERIRDFRQMSDTIELLHNRIHGSLGGDMGTMRSPNDPIFFMHHAFVDKMWDYWQASNPDIAEDHPFPDDQLPGYSEKNSDVMDNDDLDVDYF